MDRLKPGIRPRARAIGFQRWHDLLFLHWELEPDLLRPLIPERLPQSAIRDIDEAAHVYVSTLVRNLGL